MALGKQFIDLFFRVETKEAQKDIENVGEGLDNVGKKGKVASGGLKLVGNGFKFIGGAIKAAGIGLLVGLLAQLTGVFQSNQKLADTFGRIMIKLQPIFQVLGDVINVVVSGLEYLIDLFTGAIGWIGDLIGVTDGYASSSADLADEIVNLRNEQKLMNAELALTQLQYQREAELQRQIRDDTSRTMEERIAANEELGNILAQQSSDEIEMANVALDLAEKELSLDRDNIDLQVAVIEAKTKLAEINERITSQRSEQLTNLTSLEQERADKQKEHSEKIQERLAKEKEAYDDIMTAMRKNIKITEEELSLAQMLNQAEEEFIKAKEHLESLKNNDITNNEIAIKQSKELMAQKKKENEQLMADIERMRAEDEARLEFEDAHEEQKDKVLGIYDTMYAGLSDKQKEFMDRIKVREKINDADNLERLQNATEKLLFLDQDLKTTLQEQRMSGLDEDDPLFLNVEQAESDIEQLMKFSDDIQGYYDSIADQTEHQFDGAIESNQKAIEEAERLMQQNQDNIDANNTEIERKQKAHQTEMDEAQTAFDNAQAELKAQSLQAVLEFRKSDQQKEIDSITAQYDKIIGLTEENSIHELELTEEKNRLIQEINDKYDQEALDKNKAFMDKMFKMGKNVTDKEIELEEYKTQKKNEALQMGIALTEKGSASYKALAIANTIIATRAGAMQVFDDPEMPTPLKWITAGLIVAQGLKSINEIRKTKIPGSDSGGGDLGGIDSGVNGDMGGDVPNLPGGALGESDSPPIQAFVVESDISDAQSLQNDIDIQASL